MAATYRQSQGNVSRRRALGVVGGAGAAAFLAACGAGGSDSGNVSNEDLKRDMQAGQIGGAKATDETPKPGGAMTIRLPLSPPLDPVVNTSYVTHRLASFVYPRLLKFRTDKDPRVAQNYEVVPDMAASMPEILDGGLRYVFKLRPDVKSHAKAPVNGRPLTSEDVKASFDRFRGETKNQNKGLFSSGALDVTAMETPDPSTVVFNLSKPYAPFLNTLANPQYLWILPKEAGAGFDPERDMIGAGPFVFNAMQPDVAISMRRHPEYFLKGQPYIDSLSIAIVPDITQALAQFQSEKLDHYDVSFEQVKDLRATNPKATVLKFPSSTFPFVFYQQRGTTPFKDERVRQALSLAIDRNGLLNLSYGGEGWWQNVVPVNMGKWWTDPKDPANQATTTKWFGSGDRAKDVADAVALLRAAGYDETRKLKLKYYYTPNGYTEVYNQQAEATQQMLKETKVFDPQVIPADYRNEYIKSGGIYFGAIPEDGVVYALQTPVTDPHDFVFNVLHSKSSRNHAGVNDPDLDALIDKEVTLTSEEERIKAIKGIVARANEKAYYAPVMTGPAFAAVQPWVKNFTLSVTYGWGAEAFANVWHSK